MSERKRKRGEESRSELSNKKPAKEASSDVVEVSVVKATGEWPPILGGRMRSEIFSKSLTHHSVYSGAIPALKGFLQDV
jgi:hypothetical protein